MNRMLIGSAAVLCLLPCSGCTSDTNTSSSSIVAVEFTTVSTAAKRTTASLTTSTTSESTTSVSDSADSVSSDAAEVTTLFQGGIGDEKDASTPKPEFFTYRFQPDAFSARLAGGNYQTVPCDLSAAMQHNIEAEYYLSDHDSDGWLDLFLPAGYEDERVSSYFVFLWNPTDEKFLTAPLTIDAVS